MEITEKQEKAILITTVIILLILFIKPLVAGDGYGYYIITRGIVDDKRLELNNQRTLGEQWRVIEYNEQTKRWVSQYAIGKPIMDIPLYIIGKTISNQTNIKDEFFIQKTGETLLPQIGITITSIIFLIILVTLMPRILEKQKHKYLITLATILGTPVIFYMTHEPTMTAIVEAGLLTIILWLFIKKEEKTFTQGIMLGIIFITRYTAGIFLIPIIAWYIKKKQYKETIKIILGFVPFGIIFLIYNTIQYGNPLGGYTKFFESYLPIHFFDIIINIQRGILWWSPIVIIGIIGILYMKDKKKWVLITMIITQFIIYGCWKYWHGFWSFGNRFFVILTPIIAIGLAAMIKEKPKTRYLITIATLWGIVLFIIFIAEIEHVSTPTNLIDTINFWFKEGNILKLPEYIFQKISIIKLTNEMR